MIISGTLEITEGATFSGFPCSLNKLDSTATTITDLKADFNSLLSKLKNAGLMEADSE